MRRFSIVLLVAAWVLAASPSLEARELYFDRIAVDARLDAEGVLHIEERLEIVFTGDWNGGERVFRLRPWHELELESVERFDPGSGAKTPVLEGEHYEVDRYFWAEGETLRWRARTTSDPLFDRTPITYTLSYRLSGVLRKRDGATYALDHDFGLPDSGGAIRRFTLDLELDPVWRPPAGFETRLDLGVPEAAGSQIVKADLAYAGTGRPSGAITAAPLLLRGFLAVVTLLTTLGLWAEGWLAERSTRYRPLPLTEAPLRDWLDRHLFTLLPEEAGALWDGTVGAPEVAATIARMVGEGKMTSRVDESGKKPELHLELEVLPAELKGYEKRLVKKLFWGDRRKTDTTSIRKHYRKTGFDPASVIAEDIEGRLEKLEFWDSRPGPSMKRSAWLFLALAGCLGLEWLIRGDASLVLVVAAVLGTLYLMGVVFASLFRLRVDRLGLRSLGFLLPSLVVAALFAFLIVRSGSAGPILPSLAGLLALVLTPVAMASSLANIARSREGPQLVAARRRMTAIRNALSAELEKPEPDLEDAWFPYLLAFGLESQVDRWFDSFGGASRGLGTPLSSTVGSGSTFSPSSGWSGGGGAFGGAGASAAWGVAAVGMGAAMAPPSSGGGSGGGSSSSSGGGGAGGW